MYSTAGVPVSEEMASRVARLLGRSPRGLEAVAVSREDGEPVVIRVASLVDDKPFPTLFWLVDRQLCYRIDREEAAGAIARLQQRVEADEQLQRAMREDHRAHISLRQSFMSQQVNARLLALGFGDVLACKGIGGIADFTRIRCLHTWYAAHLVVPNTIGGLLDAHWREG